MRVKGERILKNGAVAGYVYYSNEKKWKWRIIKGPKKGMKGGVNGINNNGVNYYYGKNKRLSRAPDNIIIKYKININGNEYRIGVFHHGFQIEEKFRGRGIGTEIMNKILKDYDFFLIKNIKDEKARKFWNKFNKLSIDEGLGKKMLDLIKEKKHITGAAFFIYNNWKWNENYDSGENTTRNLEPFNFSNN